MSSIDTLAQKIKAKHPEYNDMDNLQLVQKVVTKFPQYGDMLEEGDKTLLGNLASANGQGPIDEIMGASKDVGNMVKAGGAGIADLDASILPKTANLLVPGLNLQAPSMTDALAQAGQDVTNVEAGQPATSTAGKVGAGIGSFFTPNQIALQGLGGAVAEPVAAGLGKAASTVFKGLTGAVPPVSEFAGKVLGTEPEAVSALAENPEAVSAAQGMKGTAEDVGSFLKGIAKRGQAAAKTATEALSDETEVEGAGKLVQDTLGKLTNDKSANQLATDKLADIVKSVQKDSSEANVGQAVSDLDDLIKYNSKSAPDWSNQLRTVRQQLSNALKAQNPAYKEGIEASAATRGPLNTLQTNLGVREGKPADWTIKALGKVTDPNALATRAALEALPGGAQLTGNVANAAAKAALQQSLLGKILLGGVPMINPAIQSAIRGAPAAANAVYQGLTQ